ncbi:GDP-mannose 4,6-dehydratase [Desulfurococcus mucosus]|uniref:GDP-mannose 4,6-dehydratase n=1 Tax=Desulfurococcus mucosus TaxID=2275 RepID=UPI00064E5320|nr:GDP-mannose 4,6-dehydratase [Desulfurococcus mucosus]
MNEGRRALVTGITGFVGPHLAKALLERGYEVYGLVRRRAEGGSYRRLHEAGIYGQIKLIEGDVTDLTSLLFALDRVEPDVIFHLAAQSFVPRSFTNPIETFQVNSMGTQNLLEAVRLKDLDSRIVFAGSSEEYGLQIASVKHYEQVLEKFRVIHPEPARIPELPVDENNPLRPLSPYAVSKVHGDYLMRNYYISYGLKTVVSRAFNHEGAGRGPHFVTSSIVRQCVKLKFGEADKILIGNVNAFRDWSHVEDIVEGYIALAEKGVPGEVYVLGSARTNSVLTYILLTLEQLGYKVYEIETVDGGKRVKDPAERDHGNAFGLSFEKTKVDKLVLDGELEFELRDKGIRVKTDKGTIIIEFDSERFRPADVPILLSNPKKATEKLGFRVTRKLTDIIRDQINYYLNPENRASVL